MAIKNCIITLAARVIMFLRRDTLRSSNIRFLVFTGTSGKTLARTATAHVLRKAGYTVVSPPYGYTNELGIVLAALGIESVHLFSIAGLRSVLRSRPPQGAYVCIELGADWRMDTEWFLQTWTPFGVCITSTSTRQWVREVESIWNDKKRLMSSVQQGGFVCWSEANESVDTIRAYRADEDASGTVRSLEYRVTADGGAGTGAGKSALKYKGLGTHDISSHYAHLVPYREAFGAALACLELIGGRQNIEKDIVADYQPPDERFFEYSLANGAHLIADTYKAIPHCVNFVCDYALALPAQRRVICISAMHPLWVNVEGWYRDLAKKLSRFDEVYFIGPEAHYVTLKAQVSRHLTAHVTHIDERDFDRIAQSIREHSTSGTVIVVKAAGRYHADQLVSKLRA